MHVSQVCWVRMADDAREGFREQALDAAARVLRAAGLYAAALVLERLEPTALATSCGRRVREVDAVAYDLEAPARSLRRGQLRFAAAKLREVAGYAEAARCLEEVALDDDLGSYVDSGRMTFSLLQRSAVPPPLPEALTDFDDDADDAVGDPGEDEATILFQRADPLPRRSSGGRR